MFARHLTMNYLNNGILMYAPYKKNTLHNNILEMCFLILVLIIF